MEDRISKLVALVLEGKLYNTPRPVEYDREDLFLPEIAMSAKRFVEYVDNQEPVIIEFSAMTGSMAFDGSVEGDIFHRDGHKNFATACAAFYNKPLNNLSTFEWQHSTADYMYILNHGLDGIFERIRKSKECHTEEKELQFLDGLDTVACGILRWAAKCSARAAEKAEICTDEVQKQNLLRLSETLKRIPKRPAESFYEAVLCVYFCFSFDPDSIGLADRYLYPYYKRDMENGVLTREEAKGYLQELFIMLQSYTRCDSKNFTRGGESHFAIGGYNENGEDNFNDLSHLILESLMELPIFIPQVSLRWTQKTPREILRFAMDCERNDPYKRVAFVNDEPRIKAYTEIAGLSYKDAVSYTMVGCNEPVLPGGIYMGSSQENIARCLENTLYNRREDILKCRTFDEFYAVFESELFSDLNEMMRYADGFNLIRSRDVNLVSSIFFFGSIENAKSITQGGADLATNGLDLIGVTTVIDSLTVIRQFVYDEKCVEMRELLDALKSNWNGYEVLRAKILKKGRFFGNNDELSDGIASRLTDSIYRCLKGKKNLFGKPYLVGNLIGYNQHNVWFGENMQATPDGRYQGDPISFGIGQTDGKDMNGLTALLSSVATYDPHCIMNGPTVTNVSLDEKLIRDDTSFEKLVELFETYFRMGGVHFQLTYVSKEELLAAKKTPEKYRNLRVRISGFSDFYTSLNSDLQEDIIRRTEHND